MKRNFIHSQKGRLLLLVILLPVIVLVTSCKEDFDGYYDAPAGLEGPLFEQLEADEEFSSFVEAVEKLPLIKRAINTSGLYTIFAPTNTAIQEYLTSIPGKSSIADFDMSNEEDAQFIQDFVDRHIILNMYFEYRLNELIDEKESPIAYKFGFSSDIYRFWTRYREPKYWYRDKEYNLDRLVRPSNHVVSVYTSKYITKYDMLNDYQTIYDVTPDDFNVEGVQVLPNKRDIAAKNGVIHGINRVLNIAPFIENVLQDQNPYFYNILQKFVRLEFDLDQSLAESETENRLDSIFTKRYTNFGFNFSSDEDVATVLCPSVGTFDTYVESDVLPGYYNNFDSLPDYTSDLLIGEYIVKGRKWESDLQTGVINNNSDTIINPTISNKIIASNGIVYVVDELLLSPAFNSVAKPVLVNKDYSWMLEMLSKVDVGDDDYIRYLQNQYREFTFFLPTNEALEDYGIDRFKDPQGVPYFLYKGRKMLTKKIDSLISYLILPDLALSPGGLTAYQKHPARSGNFIGFENGDLLSIDKNDGIISLLNYELMDNGYVYLVDEVPARPEMNILTTISRIPSDESFTHILTAPDSISVTDDGQPLKNVLGLLSNAGASYTVFVPTEQALLDYQTEHGLGAFGVDTNWTDVVQYLIVKTRVYSEGSYQQKVDNPLPDDPTMFATMHKKVIYDKDNIFSEDEYSLLKISYNGGGMQIESEGGEVANIVDSYDVEAINGVVHHIDKVLVAPVKQYPDAE